MEQARGHVRREDVCSTNLSRDIHDDKPWPSSKERTSPTELPVCFKVSIGDFKMLHTEKNNS